MSGWLRRGAAAASLASERGDLWPAGTLAAFVYLGWLPLLLAVAPPNADDLAFMGISLVTASTYPMNVIALSVAVVAGFVLLVLLAAAAEVALRVSLRRPTPPTPRLARATMSGLAVLLVGTVPAVAGAAVLALAIAGRAAAEFTSPQVDVSIFLRLAAALWPFLLTFLLALLAGQAYGGAALRLALGREPSDAARGLRAAAGRLRHGGVAGVAVVAWLKDLLYLVVAYALLRVLWAPIGAELGPGLLGSPDTLLLLVGFVAIWLALLLIGGALHVAVSAWWEAELAIVPAGERASPEAERGGAT